MVQAWGRGEETEARGGSLLGRRLGVLGWEEGELGVGAGIWKEVRGAQARAGEGAVGGWRKGNQWAGGKGGGGAGLAPGPSALHWRQGGRGGGLEPEALGRPQ